MLFVALMGIFLSVPFVPPWDSDQMRVYAAVMPFLAFLPALGAMSLWSYKSADLRVEDVSSDIDIRLLCMATFLLIAIASVILPTWAYGRYRVDELDGKKMQCPAGLIVVTAYILPGTLREVGDGGNLVDLKSVAKRFLVDPLAGVLDVPMLFSKRALTLASLQQNAFPEYAPDDMRDFLHSLRNGNRFAYAQVTESVGGVSWPKLVFLTSTIKNSSANKIYCAIKLTKFDALQLDADITP